jgi:hypothetical protein
MCGWARFSGIALYLQADSPCDLLQQRLDLLSQEALCHSAELAMPHLSLAINEDRGGQDSNLVCSHCFLLAISQDGECQALPSSEGNDIRTAFGYVHGQHDYSLITVLLVDSLKVWHLSAAGCAPYGPEVQHHHLALVFSELIYRKIVYRLLLGWPRLGATADGCDQDERCDEGTERCFLCHHVPAMFSKA